MRFTFLTAQLWAEAELLPCTLQCFNTHVCGHIPEVIGYLHAPWLKEVCWGRRCCRGDMHLFSTVVSNAPLKGLPLSAEPFVKQNATYLSTHQTQRSAHLPSPRVTTSSSPPPLLVETLRASVSQREEGCTVLCKVLQENTVMEKLCPWPRDVEPRRDA